MKFDSKTIETISVSELKKQLASTGFLEPNINENDREMSWDGSVSIYKSSKHSKKQLIGRIPVQVKGHICNDLSQDNISYAASIDDLKNYLYDGGIIYLVIYINEDASQIKIYYIELPPIKLRLIIKDAEDQNTKTIQLKSLPNDNNKIATIFYNCLQNCKKQTSFSVTNLKTIDELEQEGILESLVIPVSSFGHGDPQMDIITNDVYLYARIKGTDILQPIEMFPENKTTQEEVKSCVSINGKNYYNEIEIIKSIDSVEVKIGDSLSIMIYRDKSPSKIRFKSSNLLRNYVVDLDFMIHYIENGSFEINGVNMPFDYDNADFSNFDMETQKERLNFLSDFVKVLDLLNCDCDLDLSQLGENDWRNMNKLIIAFIKKEPVTLKEGLPPIVKYSIGEITLVLCLKLCNGETNKYYMYDFFKTEISVVYENENNEKLPTSQYAVLHADDIISINNIRYDLLLPSFQNVKYHEDLINRANWFLLELLKAYDMSGEKQIIKTAHDFIGWIRSKKPDIPEFLINQMQIVKRERSLNIIEINELYNIINDNRDNIHLLTAIYLLLDQEIPAKINYDKLSLEDKKTFKSYPIFRFCHNKDNWK